MAHSIKLLYGNDPARPGRILDLASGADNVYLSMRSAMMAGGEESILWTDASTRVHGQRRVASSRQNTEMAIALDLRGASIAQIELLRQAISRFFEDARRYEEEGNGAKVWLEYRWDQSLSGLPQPVFGQFSRFWQVYAGGIPKWPQQIHDTQVLNGAALEVACNLICAPFGEGLERRAGTAGGQILLNGSYGTYIGAAPAADMDSNAGFESGLTGWTAGSGLTALAETTLVRTGSGAARLIGNDTFTRFLLCSYGDPFVISCFSRRPDGQPVTASNIAMYANASSLTTSIMQIGNWYYCCASFDGGDYDNVGVETNGDIVVDDFVVAQVDVASPGRGELSSSAGALNYSLADELSGRYTLTFWCTFGRGPSGATTDDISLLRYYVDANNHIDLSINENSGTERLELEVRRSGTTYSGTGTRDFLEVGETYYFAIVAGASSTVCYYKSLDGIITGSITAAKGAGMAANGTLYLGCYNTDKLDSWLDGLRIFQQTLTSDEIDELFETEQAAKQGGLMLGQSPWLWTKDGDRVVDAVDGVVSSAAKDNWAVIGGAPGEVEALCEWHIQPPTSTPSRVYWLGRKESDEPFTPSGQLWLDFSGTAASGSASGDAYESSGAGTGDYVFDATLSEVLPGPYEFLARLRVQSASVVVRPYYQLGSGDRIEGDPVTISTNANFLFQDCGELWLPADAPGDIFKAGLVVERDSSATVDVDFVALLPARHSCRVEAEQSSLSIASGDKLVLAGRLARMLDASEDFSQVQRFEFQGDPVTVLPGKYNFIFLLQGEEGQTYDVTDTATVDVYLIPRYLLPGGPVA